MTIEQRAEAIADAAFGNPDSPKWKHTKNIAIKNLREVAKGERGECRRIAREMHYAFGDEVATAIDIRRAAAT